MKLGVLTVALGDMSLDAACKFLSEQGVQMVEIGCGGFPGTAHCNAAELLADENKQKEFLDTIHKYGLEISALSAHGNAVHPDKAIAKKFDEDLTNAILLAEKLGVPVVNTFPVALADLRRTRLPTGLPVLGRMIFPRFWNISGTMF